MALKRTVHEKCQSCGARNARVIGDVVKSGHVCPNTPPGPPTSPWRENRLSDVIFVPGEFSAEFLAQELHEAWATIEDLRAKRWRAERAASEAVQQAMRAVYDPGRPVPPHGSGP